MNNILERIRRIGLVPVIQIDDANQAVPLAKALCAGGLPCAEVTFRTDAAEEALRRISREVPEMVTGAGTVLTPEQAGRAAAAGAKFVVSPGLNPKVVRYCLENEILALPGCANASDIEAAMELGLGTVKFFPAEAAGGIAYIKALSAPYSKIQFMPTGGIGPANLNSYLTFEKILACGGSWMVKPELIASGNFAEIERLTREAVETMLGFQLAHIGINAGNAQEAGEIARLFEAAFGFQKRETPKSVFADPCIEVMSGGGRGKNGHIAIGTRDIVRAADYFERRGYILDWDNAVVNGKGKLHLIYLQEEFAGFGIHLLQQ